MITIDTNGFHNVNFCYEISARKPPHGFTIERLPNKYNRTSYSIMEDEEILSNTDHVVVTSYQSTNSHRYYVYAYNAMSNTEIRSLLTPFHVLRQF